MFQEAADDDPADHGGEVQLLQRGVERHLAAAAGPHQQDAGGGYTSVRSAYEHVGPSQFYAEHGEEYSNPHGAVLTSLLQQALSSWASSGLLGLESCSHGCGSGGSSRPWRVLDLACGGGEASLALEEWWSRCSTSTKGCQPSGGPKRDESILKELLQSYLSSKGNATAMLQLTLKMIATGKCGDVDLKSIVE